MVKSASPELGFNDNLRRKGRNFHVQTEDSGVARPHIITHLFTDGGRIIKSVKQSYADWVHESELGKLVRGAMKAQHLAMMEGLKRGDFDELVWGKPNAAPASPPSAASAQLPPSSAGTGSERAAVESVVQPAQARAARLGTEPPPAQRAPRTRSSRTSVVPDTARSEGQPPPAASQSHVEAPDSERPWLGGTRPGFPAPLLRRRSGGAVVLDEKALAAATAGAPRRGRTRTGEMAAATTTQNKVVVPSPASARSTRRMVGGGETPNSVRAGARSVPAASSETVVTQSLDDVILRVLIEEHEAIKEG